MGLLLDPEFWVAVGFLLMVAILLWAGAHRLVNRLLDRRAAVIAAELAEARRLRDEAAALLADYRKRAQGAEAEALGIVETAAAEAKLFAENARAELAAQIARRAKAAEDKITQAETHAIHEIRELAADAAVRAAEKLIAARMTEERSHALIRSSISDLNQKLN